MSKPRSLALIGDIGGTNARFALVTAGSLDIQQARTLQCADYQTPEQAIRAYLDGCDLETRPEQALLALAGPVHNEPVVMTNNHWSFSRPGLKEALNLQSVTLVNDFFVQAMAMPYLEDNDRLVLRDIPEADDSAPRLVFGPGTGLGVATLVRNDQSWHVLPGEGGHANLPTRNKLEEEICDLLRKEFGVVSCEHIICGDGLERLYKAYSTIYEWGPVLSAPEITASAQNGGQNCETVLHHWFDWMGCIAGNAALVTGARGGVYLTGGILPRIQNLLTTSSFLKAFNDKGVMADYNRTIPVTLNLHTESGLLGAAAALL